MTNNDTDADKGIDQQSLESMVRLAAKAVGEGSLPARLRATCDEHTWGTLSDAELDYVTEEVRRRHNRDLSYLAFKTQTGETNFLAYRLWLLRKRAGRTALVLAALLTLSAPVSAQSVRVIDGDGFELNGITYRLWGIDAPELAQTCEEDDKAYPCGAFARLVLENLIAGDVPQCAPVERDRYGRTVARCTAGKGGDLGSMMVTLGWALDYARYSDHAYRVEQDMAQAAGRGLWRGSFVVPWKWRQAK